MCVLSKLLRGCFVFIYLFFSQSKTKNPWRETDRDIKRGKGGLFLVVLRILIIEFFFLVTILRQ
jgi:hypothetical protein